MAGGKRIGAGRKPKAEEISTIEAMDAVMVPSEAWQLLADVAATGDVQAIKLWLSYRVGVPKQTIDMDVKGEIVVWQENKTYVKPK